MNDYSNCDMFILSFVTYKLNENKLKMNKKSSNNNTNNSSLDLYTFDVIFFFLQSNFFFFFHKKYNFCFHFYQIQILSKIVD